MGCPPLTSNSVGKPIELWLQDEARVGQQGSLTYIWAEQDSRPTAPRDRATPTPARSSRPS